MTRYPFFPLVAASTLIALMGMAAYGQRPKLGIKGQQAPGWGVEQWFNLPDGARALDVTAYRDKVLYVYGFQSWCPGCHQYGFPTLQKIIARYGDDPEVGIVAIQTTFEGFQFNTFEQAKQVAEQYDLDIPIGQSGSSKRRSVFMRRYRTGGTPWTVIVDRGGVVRYNDFHVDPQHAIELIRRLKSEPGAVTREREGDEQESQRHDS